MKKNEKPLVSILCLSYNQKDYIRQAIDSFLVQETDFSYEILINDDASTDGTKEIIEEYAKKHANIRPVFHKENEYQKGKRNMIIRYLLPKVQGKYIAMCEGDDFWTDNTKLQQQVDFLEAHKEHALVFHPVRMFFEKGEHPDTIFPEKKSGYDIKSLLKQNFIQTNTVMYRARKEYNDMVLDVMPGDWYLHLYHAQFGKIGFIDKVMSAYRRHESGIWWSSLNDDKSKFWNTYGKWYIALHNELLKMYTKPEYKSVISGNIQHVFKEVGRVNGGVPSDFASEIVATYPLAAAALIGMLIDDGAKQEKLLQENELLRGTLTETENRLALIKQSKVWRMRNKLAKYIKRERL